jgi:1-deoxy-D-xylulose-5-phosphate reductoisomerase
LPTRVCILGSTGSIGRSALDVVRSHPGRFEVVGLAAHSNVSLLAEQVREFRPAVVAMMDEAAGRRLGGELGIDVLTGPGGLECVAGRDAEITLCAVVGAVGLKPILAAVDAGNRIALANKEPLVTAGRLILERARARGVDVLPVDSEHNAIFQCLHGHGADDVRCIHLTASGGPFYGRSRESLAGVSPEEAANHPRWDMGKKISVDSATLMNKGLEVIEAMWLFDLPLEKVKVIIHPQSIVHGMVEFVDGSILAHLGVTDMKAPIQFALTWPERLQSPMPRLNLAEIGELNFAEPDFGEFPCLGYATEAAATGGTAPAILNAANEIAVAAFCEGRIPYLAIGEVIRGVMGACAPTRDTCIEVVLEADATARGHAQDIVRAMGV